MTRKGIGYILYFLPAVAQVISSRGAFSAFAGGSKNSRQLKVRGLPENQTTGTVTAGGDDGGFEYRFSVDREES
jgi:hypothetical protein